MNDRRMNVLILCLTVSTFGLRWLGNLTTDQWSVIAGLMALCGYIVYCADLVLDKKYTPNSSWIVWVLLDWTSVFGMYTRNELNGLVLIYSVGATATAIFLVIRDGMTKWTQTDKVCTAISLVGIALWIACDYVLPWKGWGPVVGVVLAQVSGLVGSWPMVEYSWKEPTVENRYAWSIWAFSCYAGLFAVSAWGFDLENVVRWPAPVTFSVIETTILIVLYLRLRRT